MPCFMRYPASPASSLLAHVEMKRSCSTLLLNWIEGVFDCMQRGERMIPPSAWVRILCTSISNPICGKQRNKQQWRDLSFPRRPASGCMYGALQRDTLHQSRSNPPESGSAYIFYYVTPRWAVPSWRFRERSKGVVLSSKTLLQLNR